VRSQYQKHGKKWRVQVFVTGRQASKSFDSKPEACLWAVAQEANMGGDLRPAHTLIEAQMKCHATAPGPSGIVAVSNALPNCHLRGCCCNTAYHAHPRPDVPLPFCTPTA